MKPEVSVFVTTYNHRDYIAQALDSVIAQQTKFPFEVIVHDDASTDGTTDIIKAYERAYPNIITGVYRMENQFQKGNISATWDCLEQTCQGVYCALLDGDDYWTDVNKLQSQYDYMQMHPECSLAIHNAWRFDVRTGEKVLLNTFPESGIYSQREQVLCGLGSKFPALGSYFFVIKSLYSNLPRFVVEAGVGDYPMRQILANRGAVYYDEKPMSVYRYMTNGSYMRNLAENIEAYWTYVFRMSTFYKKLSRYLDQQYEDIYERKIDSDVLGLAAATYDNRAWMQSVDDEWFLTKLNTFYELLSGSRWIDALKRLLANGEAVWIYGTSVLAAICKRSLERNGIAVKGFVVSDGYAKLERYEDCVVKYLSETKGYDNFYVIGAQPINVDGMIHALDTTGENRYFAPFLLK